MFVDLQGTLQERLSLFILALALVKQGQVVEAVCHVGMVGTQDLFVDLQGTLVERLGLRILGTLIQVECDTIQEACRLRKYECIPFNQCGALECVRQVAFTGRPCGDFYKREGIIEGSYGALGLLASGLFSHAFLEDHLYQAMDHQQMLVEVALHQRKAAEYSQGSV